MLTVDPERFRTAASHFAAFFRELSETFLERDDVLAQFALALLSREHVLMTGPPGTAKSNLAAVVLRRIIDESTGEPSVFSRHFTENTVQTDLVGPIDFKTLMETGRTEHFTEDGMLGAVHAFLDEVLDGRDMLLRSTLNLLLERELKQGSRVTRGRIECAFMTSNRYISEILESSRETLLAFIDRVAFINFVPRGFADPANLALVVRRQAGGTGGSKLLAPLSVQDLDVLQAAADAVYVPEELCDSVAHLIEMLDGDLAQAARSDPGFSPTRYLSTRTVVRSARLLRAACVYKKIFAEPDRRLEANHSDLVMLRLSLLLSGLPLEGIARRIMKESDPRERRQLEILRTEREIFDRCLKRLPEKTSTAPKTTIDVARLEKSVREAETSGAPKNLLIVAKDLAAAAHTGGQGADRAAQLLAETIGALTARALREGIAPAIDADTSSVDTAASLSDLAADLEKASPSARPTARWLRSRASHLLEESGALAAHATTTFEMLTKGKATREELLAHAEARLERAAGIAALRHHLRVEGADEHAAPKWSDAIARFLDEQVLVWDAVLERSVQEVLRQAGSDRLTVTLAALSPVITRVDAADERIAGLGADRGALSSRVLGPRMRPLVGAVFNTLMLDRRRALVKEVASMRELLRQSQLADVIGAQDLLLWSAELLVRDAHEPESPAAKGTRQGWLGVRDAGDPDTILETLVEIALGSMESSLKKPESPSAAISEIFGILRALPPHVRERAAAIDLRRVETRLAYLESWWAELSARDDRAGDTPAAARVRALERIMSSGFMFTMRAESAPASLAMEAASVADIFPDRAEAAEILRARLEKLDRESTDHLISLLQSRADEAWHSVLKSRATR